MIENTLKTGDESYLVIEDRDRLQFLVSRSAFTVEAIRQLEIQRIFSRCWVYVGHESELGNPNDFLTRRVGGRNLIFNRDRKGEYRVFLNSCPHRGAEVVREPSGSAISFKCFYHGWAFNNNGKFATRHTPEEYPANFNDDGCKNLEHYKVEEFRGFYFVNFDTEAIPLEEYLGEARRYIELVADQAGPDGMVIEPGEQKYSVRANWKLLVENSMDGYHGAEVHTTFFSYLFDQLGNTDGDLATRLRSREKGLSAKGLDLGGGHACITSGPSTWARPVAHWTPSWGEEVKHRIADKRDDLVRRFGSERAEEIASWNRNFLVFPNLMFVDIVGVTVRTFFPESPDYMTVNAWSLAPKGEDENARTLRHDNYTQFFGPGGFATPDDVEALQSCQRGYASRVGTKGWNDISRGMAKENPVNTDEEQMRAFWREWGRRLGTYQRNEGPKSIQKGKSE